MEAHHELNSNLSQDFKRQFIPIKRTLSPIIALKIYTYNDSSAHEIV